MTNGNLNYWSLFGLIPLLAAIMARGIDTLGWLNYSSVSNAVLIFKEEKLPLCAMAYPPAGGDWLCHRSESQSLPSPFGN
jgi:hypothetical protein